MVLSLVYLALLKSEGVNGGRVSRERSLRSQLYRDARIMGNVQAAAKGPGAYAKRYVRRKSYAKTNAATRAILRSLGLSR